MYIKEMTIKNFRMFKNLNLKLNKHLNVFVGPNNSGKTAILDAIKYVLDTNSTEYIAIDRANDFFKEDQKVPYNDFSIMLKFADLQNNEEASFLPYLNYEKELEDKLIPYLYLTLNCSKSNENRKGFIRRVWHTGKDGKGKDLDIELKERLAITYLKPLRDAETELRSSKNSRLAKILEGYINLEESEFEGEDSIIFKEIKKFNKNIEDIIEKYKDKESISSIIKEKYLDNIAIENNKNIKLHISNTENKTKYREILNKMNLEYVDSYGKEGLGYQNILFMAAEMLLLENSKKGYAPIMVIEEPEAHLHPQLQLKLLKYLKENKNFQMFISTHSPNISCKVHLNSLFLCHQGQVFSLRPEETCLAKEDYIFLEKFLDVTKADIFFAKGLIFVEGVSEQIVLPDIAKKMNKDLTNKGISIINIGGTSFKRYAHIFMRKDSREKINIPIAFITDLDLDIYEDNELQSKSKDIQQVTEHKIAELNNDMCKCFLSKYKTFEVDWINTNKENVLNKLNCEKEFKNNKEIYDYIKKNNKKSDLAYMLADSDINNVPEYLKNAIDYVWEKK